MTITVTLHLNADRAPFNRKELLTHAMTLGDFASKLNEISNSSSQDDGNEQLTVAICNSVYSVILCGDIRLFTMFLNDVCGWGMKANAVCMAKLDAADKAGTLPEEVQNEYNDIKLQRLFHEPGDD